MLTERVKKFAGEYDMLRSGELVLAAVSGGCDSVCMLHMLLELSESMGFSVAAAHFDHRLRGEESARDAEFVEKLCRALGVELYMGSGDVAQYARQKGTGTEEAARILRYRFLEDTADKIGAVKIATAHNADDNAETVIFNLIRGAGTRGLCGIPAVRGRIIRPVMCLTRREIEGYLNEKGIAHVDDSTNESDDYTRNKIRHHIVPLLRDINPAAVKNILSSKRSLERDEAYLSELADDFIKNSAKNGTLPVQALLDLPEAVSARVIKKLCPRAESRHIRALLDMCGKSAASWELSLPDMTARMEYGVLTFGAESAEGFEPLVLEAGRDYIVPSAGLKVTVSEEDACSKIYKTFNTFLFKKDEVCGNIILRTRMFGDKINITGCNKDLKKLFIERRIPKSKRGITPVIADDRGVLAVYGLGADKKTLFSGRHRVIVIKFEEII